MEQEIAWQISIGLSVVVGLSFLVVVRLSGERRPYEQVQPRAYKIRRRLFLVSIIAGVGIAGTTLANLPYADQTAKVEKPQIIKAVGYQWYWELSANEVVANRPVEFRVTSTDVNHGFGLFDSAMRLVTQTQAMPGYTSVLRHTFTKAGTYRVLCLEYCGVSHHDMPDEIIVSAALNTTPS